MRLCVLCVRKRKRGAGERTIHARWTSRCLSWIRQGRTTGCRVWLSQRNHLSRGADTLVQKLRRADFSARDADSLGAPTASRKGHAPRQVEEDRARDQDGAAHSRGVPLARPGHLLCRVVHIRRGGVLPDRDTRPHVERRLHVCETPKLRRLHGSARWEHP